MKKMNMRKIKQLLSMERYFIKDVEETYKGKHEELRVSYVRAFEMAKGTHGLSLHHYNMFFTFANLKAEKIHKMSLQQLKDTRKWAIKGGHMYPGTVSGENPKKPFEMNLKDTKEKLKIIYEWHIENEGRIRSRKEYAEFIRETWMELSFLMRDNYEPTSKIINGVGLKHEKVSDKLDVTQTLEEREGSSQEVKNLLSEAYHQKEKEIKTVRFPNGEVWYPVKNLTDIYQGARGEVEKVKDLGLSFSGVVCYEGKDNDILEIVKAKNGIADTALKKLEEIYSKYINEAERHPNQPDYLANREIVIGFIRECKIILNGQIDDTFSAKEEKVGLKKIEEMAKKVGLEGGSTVGADTREREENQGLERTGRG